MRTHLSLAGTYPYTGVVLNIAPKLLDTAVLTVEFPTAKGALLQTCR